MKKLKGFTLIELVIVIAILGILAGLAIPRFQDAQARANSARVLGDLRTIQPAVEMYITAGNKMPSGLKTGNGGINDYVDNGKKVFPLLVEKGFLGAYPYPPNYSEARAFYYNGGTTHTLPKGMEYGVYIKTADASTCEATLNTMTLQEALQNLRT
ncbi:pilin [Phascolarctobacterium faecium]|uniref:pilin n=1 Tax=Phascolarctobacterium faecium TaxID=33025 RepID=UPI003AEF93E2